MNLVELLISQNISISTVESLTGGALGTEIVKTANASRVYYGSLVLYRPEMKKKYKIPLYKGVVNTKTARRMVDVGLEQFNTDLIIATTGNAGPTSQDGNVGQVFVCIKYFDQYFDYEFNYPGVSRKLLITTLTKNIFEKIQELL